MSIDYALLWILTVANSFVILLLVRQLAQMPMYRRIGPGPRPGVPFTDWTLRTLQGLSVSGGSMASEYMMLFASEGCEPCHALIADLTEKGRPSGHLIVAVDADAPRIRQEAAAMCDELLVGADHEFRERFGVPGTPFAIAVRNAHVVASGPARTSEELRAVALALHSPAANAAAHA